MQGGLGVADVGTPAGKRGRHADRNRLRNRRQPSRGLELRIQRLRVLPRQHRERVLAAPDRLLVGRKLGFEAGKLGPRGIDIRLAGETMLVPVLGQIGDLALRGDEFERDLFRHLRRAQLKVGLRDFRFERNQHVVPRLDRAGALRVRRLDLAAHLAEQIDLPRRVESELIQVDRLLERPDQLLCLSRGGRTGIADPLALEDPRQPKLLAVVGCGCIQARQTLRASRLHLNARLDDPQVRHLEIEIARRGLTDQLVEFRVVKLMPPERGGLSVFREPRSLGRRSGVGRTGRAGHTRITVRQRFVRRLIIRPHLACLDQQGGQRGRENGAGGAHQ